MLPQNERQRIIGLIKREVVPAIGCTEPIAVALCTARATELLGCIPEKISLQLSANILKNAMGVGIPGTGMIGLPIAIALGALIGKSEYQLEVLRDCTPEAVECGKRFMDEGRIDITLKKSISEKLYIEVLCEAEGRQAEAIIATGHTNFVYLRKGEEVLVDKRQIETLTKRCDADSRQPVNPSTEQDIPLTLRKVFDFATTAPLEEIDFILEARRLNKAAAEESFKMDYGHGLGRAIREPMETPVVGDSIFAHILAYTSGACDARMAGAMIPVMSNSGSGNQGISATMPVVIYAEETHKSEEQMVRALILSHLTVIYIKQSLGRLSALCGCVVAATGSSCGITYLMGGTYEQVAYAVKNMIANITGMICDGAKPSCAMKVTSGVATAVFSALLAMQQKCVTSCEGIIDDDVDQCIRNLTRIGSQGMNETDRLVLDIMTHKGNPDNC